jgi:hypothetical protein
MKLSKRQKLEQTFKFTSSSNSSQDVVQGEDFSSTRSSMESAASGSATNIKTCMYHKLEEITFNHAKNYLDMLNQLTAANFYVTSEGNAMFKSHDTISSANISIDKCFPLLTNRVSSFFDKVSIPYTIEHSINTQVYIIHVKNIQEYQQQIKKAYRQPINWYDEDEITHIMETEIANRKDGGFLSAACVITPLASKEDGKYYELSSSPMYVYGEKKTDPISLYHFARVSCKLKP